MVSEEGGSSAEGETDLCHLQRWGDVSSRSRSMAKSTHLLPLASTDSAAYTTVLHLGQRSLDPPPPPNEVLGPPTDALVPVPFEKAGLGGITGFTGMGGGADRAIGGGGGVAAGVMAGRGLGVACGSGGAGEGGAGGATVREGDGAARVGEKLAGGGRGSEARGWYSPTTSARPEGTAG